jgi:hypothetical protein
MPILRGTGRNDGMMGKDNNIPPLVSWLQQTLCFLSSFAYP